MSGYIWIIRIYGLPPLPPPLPDRAADAEHRIKLPPAGPGTLLRALVSVTKLVFATLDSALQAYVSLSLG